MSVIKPEIDELLTTVDSKYTLCILASKRARQINDMIHGVRDQALLTTLIVLAVLAFGVGIWVGLGYPGLYDKYGEARVIDTPISESAIVGAAAGAALVGMRPVAEIMFADFIGVCMDQITNHAAKQRYMAGGATHVPLTIRTIAGGGIGGFGAQHSQSLESWFMHVPGLKVAMPSTPYDAKGLLLSAIRDPNPVCFVEHKLLYKTKGEVPENDYTVPIGSAEIKRQGTDITVVASSVMVPRTLEAAAELEAEGISIECVDPRTLRPLDVATIARSVEKTGRLLVVHEACQTGGWAGEVMAAMGPRAQLEFGLTDALDLHEPPLPGFAKGSWTIGDRKSVV